MASSTWLFVTLAVPGSVTSSEATSAAPPPDSAASNDFGRKSAMCGPAGRELRLHQLGATEDRLGDDEGVAVELDVDVVGEHGLVDGDGQAGGDVAALVGGAEHQQVGAVAVADRLGDGRGDGNAGERAGQVAGAVDLRGAVGTERAGHRVGVAAGVDGLDGAAERAGLGQQLEGERADTLPSVASA